MPQHRSSWQFESFAVSLCKCCILSAWHFQIALGLVSPCVMTGRWVLWHVLLCDEIQPVSMAVLTLTCVPDPQTLRSHALPKWPVLSSHLYRCCLNNNWVSIFPSPYLRFSVQSMLRGLWKGAGNGLSQLEASRYMCVCSYDMWVLNVFMFFFPSFPLKNISLEEPLLGCAYLCKAGWEWICPETFLWEWG